MARAAEAVVGPVRGLPDRAAAHVEGAGGAAGSSEHRGPGKAVWGLIIGEEKRPDGFVGPLFFVEAGEDGRPIEPRRGRRAAVQRVVVALEGRVAQQGLIGQQLEEAGDAPVHGDRHEPRVQAAVRMQHRNRLAHLARGAHQGAGKVAAGQEFPGPAAHRCTIV